MRNVQQSHRKLELDFTDATLTPTAGLAFVAQAARRLRLLKALNCFGPCKVHDRGASDQENVLALLGSLTSALADATDGGSGPGDPRRHRGLGADGQRLLPS